MGWQEDMRRTVVSEKLFLDCMPRYWVKARKWSIFGKDEIDKAERDARHGIDKKTLFDLSKRFRGMDADSLADMSQKDVLDVLTADEFAALSDASAGQKALVVELKIKYGIDSHNFCDGDIDTRSTDKDIESFAHAVLDSPEVASEILEKVEKFNRPLASAKSRQSEM